MEKLHIPEPCHEKWGDMSPAERGRFCDSCAKVVVDFTKKSKPEIIDYLKSAEGNTCGRFTSDQIDGPVDCSTAEPLEETVETQTTPRFKFLYQLNSWALGGLALLGFTLVSENAQGQKMGKVAIRGDVKMTHHDENSYQITVQGTVRDRHSETALARADVSIESDGKIIGSAFTNENGMYKIVLPAGTVQGRKITIKAHEQFHELTVLKDLPAEKSKITIDLTMEYEMAIMGEVMPIELVPQEQEPLEITPEEEIIEMGDVVLIEEVDPRSEQVSCGLEEEAKIEEVEEPQDRPTIQYHHMMGLPVINRPTEEPEHEVDGRVEVETLAPETLVDPIEPVTVEIIDVEPESGGDPQTENTVQPETSVLPVRPQIVSVLYPNPTNERFTLEMQERGTYTVAILDQSGKTIRESRFIGKSQTITLRDVESGVYHVRVSAANEEAVQTIELVIGK